MPQIFELPWKIASRLFTASRVAPRPKKVTDLWRRLPKNSDQPCDGPSLEDMIYHAEPWYIAWNLAGKSIELAGKGLDANRTAYQDILKKNGLA